MSFSSFLSQIGGCMGYGCVIPTIDHSIMNNQLTILEVYIIIITILTILALDKPLPINIIKSY